MDLEACKGCIYVSGYGAGVCCGFLDMTGHIRPCPPGRRCTVKTLEGGTLDMGSALKIDDARARELYDLGKVDREIADELGTSKNAITAWRSRNGLAANRFVQAEKRKTEVTVEIPEGLMTAAERAVSAAVADGGSDAGPDEADGPGDVRQDEPVCVSVSGCGIHAQVTAPSFALASAAAGLLSRLAEAMTDVPDMDTK